MLWHRGVDDLPARLKHEQSVGSDNHSQVEVGTISRCLSESSSPAHSMLEKPKIPLLLLVKILTLPALGLFVCGKFGLRPFRAL